MSKDKTVVKIKLIEIDKNTAISDWRPDDEKALHTLREHPGFQALLKKIRLQKAYIDNGLRTERDKEQIPVLQGWAQALRWLERFGSENAGLKAPKIRPPYEVEENALRSIQEAISIVG